MLLVHLLLCFGQQALCPHCLLEGELVLGHFGLSYTVELLHFVLSSGCCESLLVLLGYEIYFLLLDLSRRFYNHRVFDPSELVIRDNNSIGLLFVDGFVPDFSELLERNYSDILCWGYKLK